jgi:hypothetical protein
MKKVIFLLMACSAMVAMPLSNATAELAPIKFKPLTKGEVSKLLGNTGARGGKLQLPKRFRQKSGARGKKLTQNQIIEASNKLAKRLASKGIDVRDKTWQAKLKKREASTLRKANAGWLKLKGKKAIKLQAKSKTGFRFFTKGSRGKTDRRFKVDGKHKIASSGSRGSSKKQEYVWEKKLNKDSYSYGNKKFLRIENTAGVGLRAKSKYLKFNAYANSSLYVAKKKHPVLDSSLVLTATDKKFSSKFHMTFGKGKPWKPAVLNVSKNAALDIKGHKGVNKTWTSKGEWDLYVIDVGYSAAFTAKAGVHYTLKVNPTLVAASAKPYAKATAKASAYAQCFWKACWGKISGSATIVDTHLDVAGEAEIGGDNKGLYVVTQAHANFKLKALAGNIKAEWDCILCSKGSKNLTKGSGFINRNDDIFRLNQKKTYLIGAKPGSSSGGKKPLAGAGGAIKAAKSIFNVWRWRFQNCAAGHKCIINEGNKKLALNIENHTPRATTWKKIWWSSQWKIHPVKGQKDTYRIVNRWKGKNKKFKSWPSLVVERGRLKVRVANKNDTKSHWIITTNKDGTKVIKSRTNTKLMLGTNGKKTGLGAKLQ